MKNDRAVEEILSCLNEKRDRESSEYRDYRLDNIKGWLEDWVCGKQISVNTEGEYSTIEGLDGVRFYDGVLSSGSIWETGFMYAEWDVPQRKILWMKFDKKRARFRKDREEFASVMRKIRRTASHREESE